MTMQTVQSVRLPADMREQYDALARASGQSRNALIVQAMQEFIEREMADLALIQEGFAQIDRGETLTLDEVVAEFAEQGLLDRAAFEREREQRAPA